MSFDIRNKSLQQTLERHFAKAQREHSDALEKLSTGVVFSKQDPRPSEHAIAQGLEVRLRGLSANKRNMNDAVNLLQTAESGLNEVSNIVVRMKEINMAAANTTISNDERKYLFIEYQALHDELDRIALTTEYQGIPLLNGNDPKVPESLIFRLGDPFQPENDKEDINKIDFKDLKSFVATTMGLGIRSAVPLLQDNDSEEGISLEDIDELLAPIDEERFSNIYDEALGKLADQRTNFSALQSRLQRASDFIDVYQENLQAAKSGLSDIDYAAEVSRLVESQILMQAGTAMLSQGNIQSQLALNLLQTLT